MQEVVGRASMAFALKVLGAGLGFVFHVVLARILGAEGAGLYFLAVTVAAVVAVAGRLGLDNALIRFTAVAAAKGGWPEIRALHRTAMAASALASGGTALFLFLFAPWIADLVFHKEALIHPLRWISISVVPLALLTLYAQLLKGIRRTAAAIAVLSVWVPLLSLPSLPLLAPAWGVAGAAAGYTGATVLTLIIGFETWRRIPALRSSPAGSFPFRQLWQSARPLFVMALLQLVVQWAAHIMLGIRADAAEVGIFGVASRTAMLVSFIIIPVSSIAAPKFAGLYHLGDLAALERTARSSAGLMTLAALPVLAIMLAAPRWVMSVFGSQFVSGAPVLFILAAAQFFNVTTGLVGAMLMMCGQERSMRNIIALSAGLTLSLCLLLIPSLGALGAAISTAAATIFQNGLAVVLIRYKLGIWTMPSLSLQKTGACCR